MRSFAGPAASLGPRPRAAGAARLQQVRPQQARLLGRACAPLCVVS